MGSLTVVVSYKHHHSQEPLLVVEGSGPNLLGRNWLDTFSLIGDRLIRCSRVHCMQSFSNMKLYFKEDLEP